MTAIRTKVDRGYDSRRWRHASLRMTRKMRRLRWIVRRPVPLVSSTVITVAGVYAAFATGMRTTLVAAGIATAASLTVTINHQRRRTGSPDGHGDNGPRFWLIVFALVLVAGEFPRFVAWQNASQRQQVCGQVAVAYARRTSLLDGGRRTFTCNVIETHHAGVG